MSSPGAPTPPIHSTSAGARTLVAGRLLTGTMDVAAGLVAVEAGRIIYAGREQDYGAGTEDPEVVRPGTGSMVLPGLIDLHCHGGFGADFPSADESAAREAIDALHRSGTTTLLASLVTASRDDLLRGISLFARFTADGLVAGIHLEGPFLSTARCGAQNPDWIRDPDLGLTRELLSAAGGSVQTMTYAPERPGAAQLVDLLLAADVIPSLGHTDADSATAFDALALVHARRGLQRPEAPSRPAGTVTHLFNGMPPMHHRSPGPVPACLRAAKAGLAVVELIADDTHLDGQTVLAVFELAGADNIVLVTDSMAAAGLADGTYALGRSVVEVKDGVARLSRTGSIAGGTATLLQVLQRTIAAGVPAADAIRAATLGPARVLDLSSELGDLRPGMRADLIIVDSDFALQAVMRDGSWLDPQPSGRT
ncbi:MAG TPA: amidohydrolase family protein [Propionibacteriaceae bacterium]|nr:amidohydrolase family protein [Propionibacteriaceae bacterium]